MSRDAAIEAGARSAALWLQDDWEEMDPQDQEKTRELVTAVIDAALPHLIGEPVGYARVRQSPNGLFLNGELYNRPPRPLVGYQIVALVPVVEP